MTRGGRILFKISPLRALAEAWLACLLLLIPMLPLMLDAHPLPRSLYLILLPLGCALLAALRLRAEPGSPSRVLARELGAGLLLGLGILGIVLGLFSLLGQVEAIRRSAAGSQGTAFFLLFSAVEFFFLRLLAWGWQRWDRLRRRRYVWGLTHASLVVVGAMGVIALIGALLYLAYILRGDIWGISPDSFFAQAVFWLSMLVLFALVLFGLAILLFLPPSLLFSFLAARKMTGRVESLANGARALRQGSLSARVDVVGEDEIAQLQADFNAMAADLEKIVEELRAEKDKVLALLDARRDLVAGISHELRNPAAAILGYTDVLRRGWQDQPAESVTRDLDTIHSEITRLQAILNDLLTASQVDAGRLQVTLEKTDVIQLAWRVVETFSAMAWSSKRVQVTLAAPGQALFALADPLRLEQVLTNLVQNAIHHTSPGGLVAVQVGQEREMVCIEVEDTGEGIPAEDLAHIWEKYYQAGSPQRRAGAGTGLGLALVRELSEAMGGSVAVESIPGQGSVFRVVLPVWGDMSE